MPSKTSIFVLTSLLCLPPAGAATTLHRCEAVDGSITFTSMSCASGEQRSVQEVHPYLPGSVIAVMPEHDHEETSGMKTRRREPGVVGTAVDQCGNLIERQATSRSDHQSTRDCRHEPSRMSKAHWANRTR